MYWLGTTAIDPYGDTATHQEGSGDLCGDTWFQPSYAANGVDYRVMPGP